MQTQTPDMSTAIKVAAWLKTTLKEGYLEQDTAINIAVSRLEGNVQRDFFYTALLEDEVTYGIAAKNLAAGYVARNGKDIAEIAKLRKQLADLESKLEPLPPYLEVVGDKVAVRSFAKYKVAGLRGGPKTAKLDGDAGRGESPGGVYRDCRFLYYCKLGRDRQVYGTLKRADDAWVIAITDRSGIAVSHKSDTARKAVLEGWLTYATRLVALGKADPTTIPLVQQWNGEVAVGHTNPAVPRDVFGVNDDGSLKEGADFRYLDDNE